MTSLDELCYMKWGEESVSLSVGMSEALGISREDLPKKQMNATIPIEYATRLPLLSIGFLNFQCPSDRPQC